ncbi:Type IV secretion (DNA transfer) protein [Moraxella macacae 0408225]|uniref:Type IV secretion (DNA transfer) protein n=1 Tax=Moraxella macacae 0408225 TaxID=1230338 RepID=L2F895_9GAMM|nr:type IV secretory system conjugative DNA transfer family protein [Moraxella macacae]ELA09262.1 Type IV secretion (DNA transfer) protein [Moraxella macacae 0408225]
MSNERKAYEYLAVILIFNVIAVVACVYFANYVFVEMAKVPMSVYGYDTILKYNEVYGGNKGVKQAIQISLGAGGILWLVLNAVVFTALFGKPKRELHGSARFANDAEIRQTGFILTPKEQAKKRQGFPSRPSVIVGKHKDKFLEFFGNEFLFVAAPTRSGKGVSIVIPNLLHYSDSVVVLDVKGENWDLTAGFRGKYQDVYLFAPSANDKCSHGYNPLDFISRDPTRRMKDLQNLVDSLYPTVGVDGNTAYFNSMAQSLLTGIILYMMETPGRPCTFAEALKLLRPSTPLNEWLIEKIAERENTPIVVDENLKEIRPLTVECKEALMVFAGNSSDNTRAGISSSCISPLLIFADPMVASATAKSDFNLADVRRKRMSIYVSINPSDLGRFEKLLNMFFSQLLNINTETLPEKDLSLKYQCLVLIDEFTSLGRVGIIQKSIAYMAGYNMRLMPIFQSKAQVEDAYGKDGARAILSNMACQIEFTPTEQEQAEELSKMLGTETVKGKSISRNRGKGGGGSISVSDQSRFLMLAQELKELPADKQLIFFKRVKPILCQKAFYYDNPKVFAKRMTKLSEPAQGLPIAPKHLPPKHDLLAILEIMRGVKLEPPKTIDDIIDGKNMVGNQDHDDFFAAFNKELGFDGDFIAQNQKMTAEE